MKKTKILSLLILTVVLTGIFIAADHIDAPAVKNGTSDIADFYAFNGENSDNIVFAATIQGLMSPSATASAAFDKDVMIEFNIDTNNDQIEDLVIQAVRKNKKMYFFGPVAPTQTGLISNITADSGKDKEANFVKITEYGSEPNIKFTNDGIKLFAGPRDDPFFFDFAQYGQILAGNAPGFNSVGNDTFAGTNVLSVIIEIPKFLIGDVDSINTWVETKRRQ